MSNVDPVRRQRPRCDASFRIHFVGTGYRHCGERSFANMLVIVSAYIRADGQRIASEIHRQIELRAAARSGRESGAVG